MRGQFRVQRTLQNRLGQLLQKTVLPGYLFHRRTPLQQLIDQLPIQSHSISSQLVEKIVYTIWFTPSLSAAKNPRISKGSEATRVPFSPTQPNIVISTGAAQALREPHSGEKPASLPTPPPNPNRRLPLRLLPIPTPCFPVKSPNPITQIQSTTSVWRSSFTQPAIMNTEIKKRAPAARGSFPLSQRNAASHLLCILCE